MLDVGSSPVERERHLTAKRQAAVFFSGSHQRIHRLSACNVTVGEVNARNSGRIVSVSTILQPPPSASCSFSIQLRWLMIDVNNLICF